MVPDSGDVEVSRRPVLLLSYVNERTCCVVPFAFCVIALSAPPNNMHTLSDTLDQI